jgi:hypothetical protein
MTNHHLKSAFELACQISYEIDQDKKRQLIAQWRKEICHYMAATKFAREAHV